MWWEYIIIVAVLILGVYCFRAFTRFETGYLSRKSTRSVESIYQNYADDEPATHTSGRGDGPSS